MPRISVSRPSLAPGSITPYLCVSLSGTSSAATRLPPTLLIGFDHLREAVGLAGHQLVGKQHRERLVADDVPRAPDRMAEPERLLLADA